MLRHGRNPLPATPSGDISKLEPERCRSGISSFEMDCHDPQERRRQKNEIMDIDFAETRRVPFTRLNLLLFFCDTSRLARFAGFFANARLDVRGCKKGRR
jgi:hypothetical protein